MKKIVLFSLALVLLTTPRFALAESEKQSALSGWLQSMMVRVVEASQNHLKQDDRDVPTAVAGLRGKEEKAGNLEPYWKGELTERSADYISYREIERSMQDGNFAKAAKLASDFKDKFPKSPLLPEVQFTLALANAGLGQNGKAVTAFEDLIRLYPSHDLAAASKEGIARLKKA